MGPTEDRSPRHPAGTVLPLSSAACNVRPIIGECACVNVLAVKCTVYLNGKCWGVETLSSLNSLVAHLSRRLIGELIV